jgi:hypothetical protein
MLRLLLPPICAAPFVFALAKQDPPQQELKCEDIYKNIKAFKGLPATELIPAMEFMASSMKWECKDCHDTTDYSKESHAIETTRQMIALQNDINEKWFNGRQEVTCATCHRGEEHPPNLPLADGVAIRHGRVSNPPKAADLIAKHIAAAGTAPVMLTRTGTLTSPNDVTQEVETKPLELIVAVGGKFRIVSGDRRIVSDGSQVTYGGVLMWGEPVAHFQRFARGWWGDAPFAGLSGHAVSGKDRVGTRDVIVVRSNRAATMSTEELYFDMEGGLLLRLANMRRSPVGVVVSSIDYEDYRLVDGSQAPMKVTVTFADGRQWVMSFKDARTSAVVDESLFKID